jgi:hypothetical protein
VGRLDGRHGRLRGADGQVVDMTSKPPGRGRLYGEPDGRKGEGQASHGRTSCHRCLDGTWLAAAAAR